MNDVGTGGTMGMPPATASRKYRSLGASRPLFSRFRFSSAAVSNRSNTFSSSEKLYFSSPSNVLMSASSSARSKPISAPVSSLPLASKPFCTKEMLSSFSFFGP